jgi:hypothetical protein
LIGIEFLLACNFFFGGGHDVISLLLLAVV